MAFHPPLTTIIWCVIDVALVGVGAFASYRLWRLEKLLREKLK